MTNGYRGPTATISRTLSQAGFTRSNCPPRARISRADEYSTGFIVWQSFDNHVKIKYNISLDDGGDMTVREYNKAVSDSLDALQEALKGVYNTVREGDVIVVGERWK